MYTLIVIGRRQFSVVQFKTLSEYVTVGRAYMANVVDVAYVHGYGPDGTLTPIMPELKRKGKPAHASR